ncbi:unnamed protein product [Anisakis simplex]|uniref:3HCDH domain-containing protein n=1 Tax=Anisakis simplex TaxID=6269 RepID=A0A0M3JM32_ANISI|nr:unnamed protein product [Anisakis simplex]
MQALGARIGGSSVELLSEMVASGHKGRKTGKGIYVYEKKSRIPIPWMKSGKMVNDAAKGIIQKYQLAAPAEV